MRVRWTCGCTNVALKESNASKKHKEQKLNICRNNSLDFCDCEIVSWSHFLFIFVALFIFLNVYAEMITAEQKWSEYVTKYWNTSIIFKLFNILLSYLERNPQFQPLTSSITWQSYETYQPQSNEVYISHKIRFMKQISKTHTISVR